MQLFKIDASTGAMRSIARILCEHFDIEEEVEGVYRMSGGGTNDDRHVVVQTESGRRFGIKTRARGGGPDGVKREAAFSRACQGFSVAEACRAVCVERVPGLDGFDNDACVVTEWVPDSKQACEILPEEKQELEGTLDEVMPQVAKWVAVNLHLGLADRGGLKNWAWSQTLRRLSAIDTESSWQSATVTDHFSIIDVFYDRRRLKTERGQSTVARAFERALKEMHAVIRANANVIGQAVLDIESARHYVSPYMSLNDDEFADRVFAEIA